MDTVVCECVLIRTEYNIYIYIYIYSQLREQEGGGVGGEGGRRRGKIAHYPYISDISARVLQKRFQQGARKEVHTLPDDSLHKLFCYHSIISINT